MTLRAMGGNTRRGEIREAEQRDDTFCLFFGEAHRKGRMDSIEVPTKYTRGPEVAHSFSNLIRVGSGLPVCFGSHGRRRGILRMLPDNVRNAECHRKPLVPGTDGRPRWGFPTVWLTGHRAGYWKSIALPQMEEQISKSTWVAVLHTPAKPPRAAGDTPRPDPPSRLKRDSCPDGTPLRPSEIKMARNYRPRSMEGGGGGGAQSLRWDFSTNAGCSNLEISCSRWKRDVIKMRPPPPILKRT